MLEKFPSTVWDAHASRRKGARLKAPLEPLGTILQWSSRDFRGPSIGFPWCHQMTSDRCCFSSGWEFVDMGPARRYRSAIITPREMRGGEMKGREMMCKALRAVRIWKPAKHGTHTSRFQCPVLKNATIQNIYILFFRNCFLQVFTDIFSSER